MQSVLLNKQIVKILEWIVEEEGIKLSRESIKKIILRSKNNLRQAIRSLEATYRHKWVIIYKYL
jgi:replication factor C subunit 3/5